MPESIVIFIVAAFVTTIAFWSMLKVCIISFESVVGLCLDPAVRRVYSVSDVDDAQAEENNDDTCAEAPQVLQSELVECHIRECRVGSHLSNCWGSVECTVLESCVGEERAR